MMNRKLMRFGICALLSGPFLLPAAEPARLPYELIYQIQKTEASLSLNFTNLYMYLALSSTLPEVGIRDLVVYIDSKDGRIPVELNPTNGSFSLPMRDSLVAEGAWVVVNQPKGTMKFEWYMGLKVGEVPTNGVHYRDLMRPLKALEVIRGEMEKIPGSPPLTIFGLKLIFPPEKEAAVVVHARSGDRVFKTGPTHALVIPYEAALLVENPEVAIPIPPEKVDVADSAGGG
jgi:hypothetical protein